MPAHSTRKKVKSPLVASAVADKEEGEISSDNNERPKEKADDDKTAKPTVGTIFPLHD